MPMHRRISACCDAVFGLSTTCERCDVAYTSHVTCWLPLVQFFVSLSLENLVWLLIALTTLSKSSERAQETQYEAEARLKTTTIGKRPFCKCDGDC